jgi:vacuolar protein sorting-associated protein 72
MSDSEDMEIEKPPERRAPSSRASKGNRMARLVAEEEEDEADNEFYQQDFWAEGDGDGEYADADDEDGGDSFDSDFGDSTASESDDDGDAAEKAVSKREPTKRSVYKDPKSGKPKGTAAAAAARPKPSHKKRPRADGEAALPAPSFQRGALRTSTKVRGGTPPAQHSASRALRPRAPT